MVLIAFAIHNFGSRQSWKYFLNSLYAELCWQNWILQIYLFLHSFWNHYKNPSVDEQLEIFTHTCKYEISETNDIRKTL